MVRLALWIIGRAMRRDPEFAWSWHCNIAMTGVDAGADHRQANVQAGYFMWRAFRVDTLRRVNTEFPPPPGPPAPPDTRRIHRQVA